MTMTNGRRALVLIGGLAVAGCQTGEAADTAPKLLTTVVSRGDLIIRAEATGTVEPVREVEVKSKASGEVLRLFIDIGDEVDRGTLLAEIDPRDVRNRFNQTQADLAVAKAQIEIAQAQLGRQRQLREAQVITQAEFENATLSHANAQASLVRAQTNHDLAELQLADVSIRAPMAGTIIQKNVEEGAVIQSASSNVSGGTALFVMADLGAMQVRTMVDETDMGDLKAGLTASVRVEAFPDRTFQGTVDKIEPQAAVVQNVTMFPVIVSIDNRSGLLKPGMNAEVEVFIDQAIGVLLVPNNAVVQSTDVGPAAMALGLDVETLDLSQFMRAGRGGRGGGDRAAGGTGQRAGVAQPGGQPATRGQPPTGGERPATEGGTAAASPQGVPADAMARIQAMRAQVESGEITQDSMRTAMQALRPQGAGGGGQRGAAAAGGDSGSAPPRETRPAAVFVLGANGVPEPRLIQIGLGDWDNTHVVTGLEEGETLVIVGAAQLQAQQQEFLNRMRGFQSGSPFGGSAPRGGGGRGR
ncbi:MAG: efflux RND transporter periplasmic adaptor subunit [Gemmatimonadetes bacterium]|nr:efflux RND transporter periplasmic adaptor subunit [Gemmatimonadota bacterium]